MRQRFISGLGAISDNHEWGSGFWGEQKELEWKEKSVSTASDALAEWRSARTRSGQAIVDWGRYHLQAKLSLHQSRHAFLHTHTY